MVLHNQNVYQMLAILMYRIDKIKIKFDHFQAT